MLYYAKQKKEDSNIANDKRGRNKLVEILTTIIILLVASVLGINIPEIITDNMNEQYTEIMQQEAEGNLMLNMIDVNQADCFLLVQDDEVALIDCGMIITAKEVVEYIESLGITKIDYVFGTHPHEDHWGGMYEILTKFEIGKIIIPKVKKGDVTADWYIKTMEKIKKDNFEVEYAKVGQIYNLGDTIIKVIGPISQPEENINNYSTVLKVSFGEMDIIMTGDAEKEVEKEILETGENIDAEILKVGHHGSRTSTTTKFLEAIEPEYALISTGNRYGHPNETTMEKLDWRVKQGFEYVLDLLEDACDGLLKSFKE